ncbi:MAG: dethiobiotin synthase, partial [Intestinibacter sp.]
MSKKIFITGTGTDVGKTYVTGLILKKLNENGLNPAYYKAAMSGNERDLEGRLIPGDAVNVKQISKIEQPLEEMCPYIYENAVSPHLASRIEGNHVKLDVVEKCFNQICEKYDYITMEGSGGIVCPICFDQEKIQLEDIVKKLNLACLIVADAGLGTINDVVLTVEYMRARNIDIKGIIFNHFRKENMMEEDNLRMCEHMTGIEVVACVEDDSEDLDIDVERLILM